VRLLLDTHVFLWWLQDSPRLGPEARRAIANPKSIVHVSAASIWEVSIKAALGRLELERARLEDEVVANGFIDLPIQAKHAWQAGQLPLRHDDPFDRMLIAQARIEALTLVTKDPAFRKYEVALLPA